VVGDAVVLGLLRSSASEFASYVAFTASRRSSQPGRGPIASNAARRSSVAATFSSTWTSSWARSVPIIRSTRSRSAGVGAPSGSQRGARIVVFSVSFQRTARHSRMNGSQS
jgi:hypothetical protein